MHNNFLLLYIYSIEHPELVGLAPAASNALGIESKRSYLLLVVFETFLTDLWQQPTTP